MRILSDDINRVFLTFIMCLSVLLGSCANPQRDRYEEAYAAIEREEQRLIEQSKATRRQSNATVSASENTARQSSSLPLNSVIVNGERNPATTEGNQKADALMNFQIPSTLTVNPDGASSSKAWWIQRYQSPSTGKIECLVTSKALGSGVSQQSNRVQLVLSEELLFLRADAAIDRNAAQPGLRVDTQLPFVFERFLDESVAVVQDNYTTILNQLLGGSFITVNAVFLTENGVPNLQIMEFSLKDFIAAYAQVDRC